VPRRTMNALTLKANDSGPTTPGGMTMSARAGKNSAAVPPFGAGIGRILSSVEPVLTGSSSLKDRQYPAWFSLATSPGSAASAAASVLNARVSGHRMPAPDGLV
jgi:hypothetical protein